MPKLKLSKSVNKRFKISCNGKVLRHKACKSHLLQKKTQKRKKKLCKTFCLDKTDFSRLKKQLHM
uniref:Large ribosomal subunit protein bL35c n=1 Tax=Kumanoa mahlacensis TaxID=1196387 RepID=A0A8K1YU42_9FLOR|nr:ribosomal protein L35 [Kumanoa mahlacensis]